MIDGCGVSGVEGVFRRVCEITLGVLRQHRGSIIRCFWGRGGLAVWGSAAAALAALPSSRLLAHAPAALLP